MNNDWIELLGSLVAHRVEFLVVGAWAMAYHGQPRYTGDVDLLNWLSGLTYDDAVLDAVEGELGGVPVLFMSRRALITNKTASGRPKDLVDAEILKREE